MANNNEIRFRVMHDDGRGYTTYYTKGGRCFAHSNNWDKRRGILVMSPCIRVSDRSFEKAREIAEGT